MIQQDPHVGPVGAFVGPMLGHFRAMLGPCWAIIWDYVVLGLWWAYLLDPKNIYGDILGCSFGSHVGLMSGQGGSVVGYLGPRLRYLGLCWRRFGYDVGPMLGCLGLCWAMLRHLG